MIRVERAARLEAEARVRQAEAELSSTRLEIERLKLLLSTPPVISPEVPR